jgi:sortase (surface protein transpeptidase)
VFKDLEALRIGDEVMIETASGEVLRFRVLRTGVYPYDSPPEGLFTRSDGAYLNLITCTGEWLQEAKTYDGRLVVYTELVP